MNKHVEITLTNRRAFIVKAETEAYEALNEYWSYWFPGCRFSPMYNSFDKNGNRIWDGRIHFLRRGSVSAGLFRATKKELEVDGYTFDVKYRLPKFEPLYAVPSNDKYRFQDESINAMLRAMRRGGGIVLNATGSGKTAICGKFRRNQSIANLPLLFIVDQLDLLYQSQKELAQWSGMPVGIIGNQEFAPDHTTVATIQTLSKHVNSAKYAKWVKSVQIVVVDELHEQLNRRNWKTVDTINPMASFGLTASLQLQKKEVRLKAWAYAGPVIYEFPIAEGVKNKVLTKGSATQLLFPAIEPEDGNYQTSYATEVTENPLKAKALKALVSQLILLGKYVIVIVDRVAHVQGVHKLFESIPHGLAYGRIAREHRTEAKEEFEAGTSQLIIANRVFKKGINVKRVDVIIDLAEMPSKNDTIQKYGRGVRLHPDKDSLLYIDFGTRDHRRYHKAARSRMRALRSQEIKVGVHKVDTVAEVLGIIRKVIKRETCKKVEETA